MKRLGLLLATLLAFGLLTIGPARAHAGFGITFGVFYSSLGSHGEWISVDAGVYAWRPMRVATGWRPYWNGRWMWTDDGWYWDSDEPWAWATYHYGRWYFDDYYGWIWVPGYEWAPAWVEWRYGGDYVGWAPLGPYAVFNTHFGIHYTRHWVTPYHYWSFVDCRYINRQDVRQYVYRTDHNTRFIGRTRTAGSVRWDNGRIVSRGPETRYVERRGDIRIPRTELVEVQNNDQLRSVRTGDRVGVYRPRVEERRGDTHSERPDNIRDRERMPSLDARQMDVRSRDVSREKGREVERMEPRRARPGDPRTSEGNTGWFEVPPRNNREGERSSQPDVRSRREEERSSQPDVRSRREGERPPQPDIQNRREGERSSVEGRTQRPTQRTSEGSAPRSQDRRSPERIERPADHRPSGGQSTGRSGGRGTEGSPTRGRQR